MLERDPNRSAELRAVAAVCALGAGTAAFGLTAWLISERAMTGRLPIGADTTA